MSLIWMKSLATGIEWQDMQHRELFEEINTLISAINQKKGKDELDTLFRFLDIYIKEHFRAEEAYMNDHQYPSAVEHKAEHERFIENIDRLKNYPGPISGNMMALEARRFLAQWFYEHVQKMDRALGWHMRDAREQLQ